MRHLFTVIIISVIAFVVYATVDWESIDLSLSIPSAADTSSEKQPRFDATLENQIATEEDSQLWIDTLMYANGHAFGYSGDITMWGGWYLDTICVGEDRMLRYDSVGPSTFKLSLVTREFIVDLGDNGVIDSIRNFMSPVKGFRRYKKSYEECLDSIVDEEYGTIKFMGEFTFEADYPDSSMIIAEKLNHFICELTEISEIEKAKVPGLSAFYAGVNNTKCYRPAYTGNVNDIQSLSDFLAHKAFESWIRSGDFDMGSNESVLAIRPHFVNERYVTFSKYEYNREGTGHGMYTETFHTFDLKNGKGLKNKDIFKSQSLDKVKMKLFETMSKDPRYLEWHGGSVSPTEIESMIEAWLSPLPILEGTEWEEPDRDVKFELPDGALTESGVVFSFQPYEIDCWAAGAYHFIVPYEILLPYLTSKSKRLIGICDSK